MSDLTDYLQRDELRQFHREGHPNFTDAPARTHCICHGAAYRAAKPLLDENAGLRERVATLEEVLGEAIDVFRHHDCPQSHLSPECHLCEILIQADALLALYEQDGAA